MKNNMIGILIGFVVVTGIANAAISVSYVNGNLFIIQSNTPSANLGYGQSAQIYANSIEITNITETNSVMTENLSGISTITAPRYPLHTTITLVNGEGPQNFNNVTIISPQAVVNSIIVNSTNTIQQKTITPIANVTFNIGINALAPQQYCTMTGNVIPSYYNQTVISNTIGPCRINETVDKIQSLGLNELVYPGNIVSNTIIGYNFTGVYPASNQVIKLAINQQYHLADGTMIDAPTANDLVSNLSDILGLVTYYALANCAPGALITFHDSQFINNYTICSKVTGSNVSLILEAVQYDYLTNQTDLALGQAFVSAITADNYTAKGYHGSLLECQASSANAIAAANYANYLNYTNRTICADQVKAQSSGNNEVIIFAAIVVLACGALYCLYRFARWMRNKDLKARGGIAKPKKTT